MADQAPQTPNSPKVTLTDEQKAKMAEGRRKAAERKAAARAAAKKAVATKAANAAMTPGARVTVPPSPEPAIPAPAAAPPVAAGGRGLVPTSEEITNLQYVYDTLRLAQALPLKSRQGRPLNAAEAMALMLKGWELGTKPIESLTGLYIADDGLIAQRADYMRARVQSSGIGLIVPTEMSDARVILEGTRYGTRGRPDRTVTIEYTLAQLQASGGLTEEARKNLRGTLFSRATGQLVRGLFSDIAAGACYTPEELDTVTVAPPQKTPEPPQTPQEPPVVATPADPPPPPPPAPEIAPEPQPAASPPPPELAEPVQRELTLAFQIIGTNGQTQEVRTAGITQETMQAIVSLSKDAALLPKIKQCMANLGQVALRYLTEIEGQALLGLLTTPPPTSLPPPPAQGTSIGLAIQALCDEFQTLHQMAVNPDLVATAIAASWDVDDVNQLSMAQAEQAIREMRHAAKDPQAFNLIVGGATRAAAS